MPWPPTRADLVTLSLPEEAIAGLAPALVTTTLAAVADHVKGRVAPKHIVNDANPAVELVKCVCDIAAYDLMITRGSSPADIENLRIRALDQRQYLRDIAEGRVAITKPDLTPHVEEGAPRVLYPSHSTGPRRW